MSLPAQVVSWGSLGMFRTRWRKQRGVGPRRIGQSDCYRGTTREINIRIRRSAADPPATCSAIRHRRGDQPATRTFGVDVWPRGDNCGTRHSRRNQACPPRPVAAMPETLEISKEAVSGNGTLENVGIKLDGKFKCPHCRQTFSDDKALQLHLKFQCSTAIAKQINPIGD
ncbi:unnamed protein product [Prorocentrum cordatum]|uniref:C2H2-type domain-containing protein n=1 Tax=Prorocentrum cordatum TaxID=2364126 RepID=A0ABN9RXV2_9DINO|nr:unnamed protein product [Polarella glacialis]